MNIREINFVWMAMVRRKIGARYPFKVVRRRFEMVYFCLPCMKRPYDDGGDQIERPHTSFVLGKLKINTFYQYKILGLIALVAYMTVYEESPAVLLICVFGR